MTISEMKRPLAATATATAAFLLAAASLSAQPPRDLTPEERARRQAERQAAFEAEIEMENPIPARDSVWIEELTWIEIRDLMAAGKTTAIVSTGGIEQNGPYVAMGKHNYVLQGACEGIARELGNALCTPIIKLVPEGGIEPKTGHMRYPGTLTVRDETFQAMLEDVASSLRAHGFEHIVLIGDSGGNQEGMGAVAKKLNAAWGKKMVHFIPEFYDNEGVQRRMNELGVTEDENDGFHDSYWLTALQMTVDPSTVRYDERVAAGKATINGVSIAPKEKTIELGRKLMRWRVEETVKAIRASIGKSS